ncbi:multidrug transporter AcrB [Pseudidiomarina salinarum]|uniref:Multidrug transporter AcrB n=1 Tax=Pseudidiomarina salinarum TaxID=435908 RepID=A0A094J1B2_9GAMM|nr:efflux RND transporter permease subunit [Pseudidiomarina salinarum]KFZ31829.1 multidrug transporter AcrB [Pseudidiomarina salinarum]RUO70398.1 AcrB/AcrD/AcrF family protein [Pseudidiomarina salinarum]
MKWAPQLNDLPSMAIRRPILIIVLNLLIIIAGYAAINGVEVRELPDVDRPLITVSASYPGAAPETVDTEVTSRLEGAVARVSGVKSIRASSEEGSSRIVVEFRPGVDLDNAANETRESVSRVQRQLPEEVENVAIIKADSDAESVVSLAISSETLNLETLTERVETDLAPNFLSIPGVADVRLNGDRRMVLRVVIDPLRLASYNLSVTQLAAALRQAPFDVPAGSLKSTDQQLIVRADASSVTVKDVEDIVVEGVTRVGDVATVFFGPADASSMVRLDGKPVLSLGIIRQAQSNTIKISNEVLTLVERLRDQYPELQIQLTSDDAKFIRSSVEEVITSLGLTILLVIATLWVFIGSGRATIIPALAIPVALIGSVAVIWALGFSINILTLLALVLATGLIVDDAIVVSENIQRRRGMGLGARAAAVIGTREVFFAVVATTAVLVAVFVPIAFLPSTAGRLFREFGGVLAAAVIISSFVALSLVPALTARLPLKAHKETRLQRLGNRFKGWYTRTLNWVLNKAVWVFAVSCLIAGSSVWFYTQIDNELMPTEDRGTIRIFARGPDGVGLNFMDRQARKMEEILLPYVNGGAVDSINTTVGQWDPNLVFITVRLTDWEQRDRSQQEIIDEISGPLGNIPGAPARAFGSNSLNLRGQGGGLEIALTGETYEGIFEAAQNFSKIIQDRMPQVGYPRISFQPTQPQLRVVIDRQRAAELGVPLSDISTTLRVAINGDDVADLNIGDQAVPIMLQAERTQINDPSDLANLYVGSATGELVPLSSLATIVEEGVAAELERRKQRRAIEIDMEMPTELALEDVVETLQELAAEHLPDDIGMVLLGEAEAYQETAREVTMTYVLAFVIVLLVLAAQFESLNSAVVVMATVPFGIAAAFFALFVTGTSINIFSQIGLVMLIGLIAKNSILLVEFADQLRDQGQDVRQAIENAAEIRLRPIMMTLVSTLLGALPLILSIGAGAEARNSIGWVVFGGLAFAVLFTLYLTPVIYLGLARFSKPRADETNRLEREMEAAQDQ